MDQGVRRMDWKDHLRSGYRCDDSGYMVDVPDVSNSGKGEQVSGKILV